MKLNPALLLLIAGAAACDRSTDPVGPERGQPAHADVAPLYQQGFDIGASFTGATAPHAVNAGGVVLGVNTLNGQHYFRWTATDGVEFMKTPAGDDFSPDAVNDRGDILGESPLGGPHPMMRWADGRWEQLTIPGASINWFAGQAINSHGTFTGVYEDAATGEQVLVLWSSATGFRELARACGVVPFGINDNDEVVGYVQTSCPSAVFNVFSWSPEGGFTNHGTLGGRSATGSAVNSSGAIVATVTYPDNHQSGVLLSPSGGVQVLPNPLGGASTSATGINDRGEIVGRATTPGSSAGRPVIWDPSLNGSELPAPAGNGAATRIASNGTVIGQVRVGSFNHAFIWSRPPLDVTAPVVTYRGNAGTYSVDQMINITCSATDAGSGIASSTCADITGNASDLTLGTHEYSATATDKAGNVGTGTTSFTVIATPDAMSNLVTQWVATPGVANSLTTKLQQGSYEAFRNEVRAQSAKKIAADKAATLIRLSLGL